MVIMLENRKVEKNEAISQHMLRDEHGHKILGAWSSKWQNLIAMWTVKHLIWGDSFILWNTIDWHGPSRGSKSSHRHSSSSPLRTSQFINFGLAIGGYIELCPPRNNKFWVPEYYWCLLSFASRVNGLAGWGGGQWHWMYGGPKYYSETWS